MEGWMLLWMWACVAPGESDPAAPGTFRAVFLADTHVIGADYVCCSENGELDNTSIMKTVDRATDLVARLNAIDPAPDLAFVLGDVTHNAEVLADIDAYDGADTAWSRTQAIFADLDVPVYFALGNHDYPSGCDGGTPSFQDEIFARYLNADPYQRVEHRGWQFLVGNSQLGPSWDPTNPDCDTSLGSFGAEQLGWMADALAADVPSVVMSHYYLPFIAQGEDPGGHEDLLTVLEGATDLRLTLAGHAHRWLDFSPTYGFPHLLVGGTRYDSDDFWVVEFEEDGDGYTILDEDKAVLYTTCADTWTYDGAPEHDPSAAETGDCGF